MSSKVDLHVHSTASDGVLSPEEVVQAALRSGLEIIGLADHDSTEGIPAALQASKGSPLAVWPAVEISTDVPRSEIHILGYFIRYRDKHFQSVLHALRQSRRERARRMVMKLAQMNLPVEWSRVLEFAGGGAVGRPHIAEAMRERGYVSSVAEAFSRYIGRNGPAYVERYKLTPVQAVALVVEASGLPVLAHPLSVDEYGDQLDLDKTIPELAGAGLVGIEIYYPGYTEEERQLLLALAQKWKLIPTGGSDFHGHDPGTPFIGEVEVPLICAKRLKALCLKRRRESRAG
ncbi:MAG: PHP domain-containing protein [Chloroflexota bacterium]